MENDLPSTLKRLIIEQNISEAEFARRVNIAQPVVNRIITGKTPNPQIDTVMKIAQYFGLSVSQIMGQQPLHVNRNKGEKLSADNGGGWKQIPLLTWEESAKLTKIKPIPKKDEAVLSDLLGDKVFALKLTGSAMEPVFPTGSLLIFDLNKIPSDGQYVLVLYHGVQLPVFKKLFLDGSQQYTNSLNPSFNDFRLVTPQDKLIAVLVQSRLDFD